MTLLWWMVLQKVDISLLALHEAYVWSPLGLFQIWVILALEYKCG